MEMLSQTWRATCAEVHRERGEDHYCQLPEGHEGPHEQLSPRRFLFGEWS